TAAVERARAQPPEVADTRESDRHEPVEELVHPGAAQRDLGADRHPLADLEAGDRLPGAADLRPLAGDRRQLLHGAVEQLGLVLGLADTHVHRDLRDLGDLHDRLEAELVLQAHAELALVEVLEPRAVSLGLGRGRHQRSISWPQSARRQTRTFTFSPLISL